MESAGFQRVRATVFGSGVREIYFELAFLEPTKSQEEARPGTRMGSFWRARVRLFGFGMTARLRRLGPADEPVAAGLEDRAGDYNSGDSTSGTVKVRRRREMNRGF
jgi:hypothetical protein